MVPVSQEYFLGEHTVACYTLTYSTPPATETPKPFITPILFLLGMFNVFTSSTILYYSCGNQELDNWSLT